MLLSLVEDLEDWQMTDAPVGCNLSTDVENIDR